MFLVYYSVLFKVHYCYFNLLLSIEWSESNATHFIMYKLFVFCLFCNQLIFQPLIALYNVQD